MSQTAYWMAEYHPSGHVQKAILSPAGVLATQGTMGMVTKCLLEDC